MVYVDGAAHAHHIQFFQIKQPLCSSIHITGFSLQWYRSHAFYCCGKNHVHNSLDDERVYVRSQLHITVCH